MDDEFTFTEGEYPVNRVNRVSITGGKLTSQTCRRSSSTGCQGDQVTSMHTETSGQIGGLIHGLRTARGLSQRQLALRSGVSNTEIKRIEDGARKQPSQSVLAALAAPLGADPLDFFQTAGYQVAPATPPPTPATAGSAARWLLQVPVFGRIGPGAPASDIIGWEELPGSYSDGGAYFVYQAPDDSMLGAHIPAGGRVLVRQQAGAEDGEIVLAASPGGDAQIRYIHYAEGQVILYPANPRFQPAFHRLADVQVLGKVVRSMIAFE